MGEISLLLIDYELENSLCEVRQGSVDGRLGWAESLVSLGLLRLLVTEESNSLVFQIIWGHYRER